MGFFKLGKLDRGKDKSKEQKEGSELPEQAPAVSSSAGDATLQDRDRKKKGRDEMEGAGSSAAMPSGGGRSGPGVTTRVQAGLSVNDFISKTKNQQRQGLKPSGPELIAYARYLGIDAVADHDLLWIAVEALEAPLPSDWTEHFDSCDRVFYYNATSRVSSWTHPLEHVYRETYKTIVDFRNSNMSPQERSEGLQRLQSEVRKMEQETQREVAKWSEHQDEQGNRFYFNKEERQSTWTDPRPAKCQVLYLKMKMLRLLLSSAAGTPGFVDPSKGGADMSRFGGMLGGSDFGMEPASKRSGGGRLSGSAGAGDVIDLSADGAVEERNSPRTSEGSAHNLTDSDSEGGKKKKKKKKKHKKHKKQKDEAMLDSAPLRPTESQSRLGGPPAGPGSGAGPAADGAGEGGAGGGGFGELGEGGSGGGSGSGLAHTKVKAGIRLQPLGSGGLAPLGSTSSLGPGADLGLPLDRIEGPGSKPGQSLEAIRGVGSRGPAGAGPSVPYP
eukprot:TRINITY_DN23199_c0_g1_i1.p1 TRINITY_DN23199_c0_g1~~TRINITY_DN23199_c0_g1_i1.p1  ORF type:complete len:499 (-),score=128.30 TRINITY_DN23199_c0_g1_i1:167-1663(-)